MNKDLYEILELNKNASDNDIKKAYRKLALKYHPDRQGDKSDAEKKKAEEKFKEISFAYSILSDPNKKEKYDRYGITDDQDMNAGFDASDIFSHFMSGFGSMFEDNDFNPFGSFFNRNNNRNTPVKGETVKLQIPLSIEEIFNGCEKEIEYNIQTRCTSCNGEGGSGIETCSHCHGTGMITETHRTSFGIMQNSHPCQYCNGSGKTVKNVCNNCHGSGVVTKTKKIKVKFNKGIHNGEHQIIQGAGYEPKNKNGKNGDLIVIAVYQIDTSKYIIQGNDIYERIDIPYYDCILGNTFEYTLPNKTKVNVNIPQYSKDGSQICLHNKSINGGNYYLVINVKMPTYINNNEKELLKKIKNENKN